MGRGRGGALHGPSFFSKICQPLATHVNHISPLTNWSSPSSKSSFRTPAPFLCSTGARGFFTTRHTTSAACQCLCGAETHHIPPIG